MNKNLQKIIQNQNEQNDLKSIIWHANLINDFVSISDSYKNKKHIIKELEKSINENNINNIRTNVLALGGLSQISRNLSMEQREKFWKKVFFGQYRSKWAKSAALLGSFEDESESMFTVCVFASHALNGHPEFANGNDKNTYSIFSSSGFFNYWGKNLENMGQQAANARADAFDICARSLNEVLSILGYNEYWTDAFNRCQEESNNVRPQTFGGLRPTKHQYNKAEFISWLEKMSFYGSTVKNEVEVIVSRSKSRL